ncbi:Intraflagellar transport protein 43, partial [Irineochytrium annulatum]
MVVIPDLTEVEDDELITAVAAPPSVKVNRVKTIRELDTDLAASNGFLNEPSLGGVDLSLLTAIALSPMEQVVEEDRQWDWDVVFVSLGPDEVEKGEPAAGAAAVATAAS